MQKWRPELDPELREQASALRPPGTLPNAWASLLMAEGIAAVLKRRRKNAK